MIEINLLPGAQRSARGRAVSFDARAVFAGVGARFTDKYLIFGTLGLAAGIAAMAFMYLSQTRLQTSLDARESAAAADSARFSAVLKARARAASTRDSVYQQLAIIKSIDDSRFIWPHLLEEINLAVPQYTWLTEVTQTSPVVTAAARADTTAAGKAKADSARKAGKLTGAAALARAQRERSDSLFNGASNVINFRIVGQTVDVQALTQFMKNLEASPFIKNVQLTRSDLVNADNKPVTEFQLEAQSQVPPAHLIRTVPLDIEVH